MPWTSACRLDELQQNEPRAVRVGVKQIVLVWTGAEVHATAALCPHKFAPLGEGTFSDGCLKCPVHEASFDVATGEPGEGEGWAGQLQVYPARIAAGTVEVDLD